MTDYPDGLERFHAEGRRPARRFLSIASLFVLGALMVVALSGVLGGHPNPTRRADSAVADLSVNAPAVLRNGEFFEMRFGVTAHRPIAKPTIAIASSYVRDLTLNTTAPQAVSEKSERGALVLSYDAMKPGDTLEVKIDGQVNPDLFAGNSGTITLRDDATPIVSLPLALRVMP